MLRLLPNTSSWAVRAPCHFSLDCALASPALGRDVGTHMLCALIWRLRASGNHLRRYMEQVADLRHSECAGLSKVPLSWIFSILNPAPCICTSWESKCWAVHMGHGLEHKSIKDVDVRALSAGWFFYKGCPSFINIIKSHLPKCLKDHGLGFLFGFFSMRWN